MSATIAAAFKEYEATARNYRSRRAGHVSYSVVEAARAALCKAIGYDWVHDHLGEYCNLHERDIPGCLHASPIGPDLYSFSGYFAPVSKATLDAKLRKHRNRSRTLKSRLALAPIDRFIVGDAIAVEHNGAFLRWRYRRGIVTTATYDGFLSYNEVLCERMTPDAAREWLTARLPECTKSDFVSVFEDGRKKR